MDGLGRALQTVQVAGSPYEDDIVQPYIYDQFGRDSVKYLPYTVDTPTPGAYNSNAINGSSGYTSGAQYQFYQQSGQGYVNTPYPYAGENYDASPLNRTVEQGYPQIRRENPGKGQKRWSSRDRTSYSCPVLRMHSRHAINFPQIN
jgi:hypothetical protein